MLPAAALARLQQLATERLGMENRPGRELLLNARTSRHMRELGVSDPAEYLRLIEDDPTGERMQGLLDLLTTNHTAFWREPGHFEWLLEELRARARADGMQTIWCAASSSGEEPYTLAMVAREALGPEAPERVRILATDVSMRMLEAGRRAVYLAERVEALPAEWHARYFSPGRDRWEGYLRVRREIRQMVHFRWLNLVDPFPGIGPFPYIFCRNVMIYFSQETRMQIVRKLLGRLVPDGYLVVGHAEGLSGLETDVEYVRPAIYRRHRQDGDPAGASGKPQGGGTWG